jgi:hypothetical protein
MSSGGDESSLNKLFQHHAQILLVEGMLNRTPIVVIAVIGSHVGKERTNLGISE